MYESAQIKWITDQQQNIHLLYNWLKEVMKMTGLVPLLFRYIHPTYWIFVRKRSRGFNIDCVEGIPTTYQTNWTMVFLKSNVLIKYGNDGYQ